MDPPTKLPIRIVIDVRPDWVDRGNRGVAQDQAAARIVMRLRQPNYAVATEDDRKR